MGKLTNAPVYFAVGQVRFTVVLAMDQYVPKIQDQLRRRGFPEFEARNIMTVLNVAVGSISPEQVPPPMPSMQTQARYHFFNEGKTEGYVLDQGMLFYQTANYDTFETFLQKLLSGLELIHEMVGLTNFERIGIRYLDAICPKSDEKISEYLAGSVLGLSEETPQNELLFSTSETRAKLNNRYIMSRTTIFNQEVEGVAFPPDLQPVTIKVIDRFAKVKGFYGVLDTDCWLEEKEKFDLGAIEKRLVLLHDDIGEVFYKIVSPHALTVWE